MGAASTPAAGGGGSNWMVPAGMALSGAAFSGIQQIQAGKAQAGYYSYLADTAGVNAGLAKAQAAGTVKQIGVEEGQQEQTLQRRVAETIGQQKVALANGVGVGSRSAQDIISDTLTKGQLDEMALRMNAQMKTKNAVIQGEMGAMNYGAQAAGYGIAGKNAVAASRMGAFSSLIGGAGSVANSWYLGNMYANRGIGGPTVQ